MTNPTELQANLESPAKSDGATSATGLVRLQQALAAGPEALREQIRYLLILSQLNKPQPVASPEPERSLTTRQARLTTLATMVDTLSERQIHAVLKDIVQIPDATIRLPLIVRFALKLPPKAYRGMIYDVWEQTASISDPLARARVCFELAPLLVLVHDEPGTSSPLLHVLALAQAIKSTDARIRSLIALAPYLPHDYSLRIFRRVLNELSQSQNDSLVSKSLATLAPHLPGELTEAVMQVAQTIGNPTERARALTALARYMDAETESRLHEQAIDAIDAIEDENDRAEALIAFAPNLEHADEHREYPALLEKALTSTIILTRRKLRARVLVALAPHLTSDLQGEALAAVHSLASERERANLLAKLAPTLPSDMLVASLAVAHTMRERDCRVQALTTLARYVPASAREQTTMDALASASNLPSLYERVQALVELTTILPDNLAEQALRTALNAAGEIDNANARARALNLLGDKLPSGLLPRALELALAMDNPQQRLNALVGLVDNLPDKQKEKAQVYDKMIECAQQMPLEYKRARALINAVPHLSIGKLQEVEELAENLSDPIDQVNVYIRIAQHLPPDLRPPLIDKATQRLNRIDEGYDRASATAAIAPYLPKEERRKLPQKAYATIRAVSDEYDEASAISLLAPLLAQDGSEVSPSLPDGLAALRKGLDAALAVPNQLVRAELLAHGANLWAGNADAERTYTLWVYLAKRLATLSIADVLLCLGALIPVLREIGGEDAVKDIAHLLGMR